mgnify:FL=1
MADGKLGLLSLLKTHVKEARIGAGLGFSGSFSFLFIDATHGGNSFWVWAIKLGFMCLSTLCTSIIAAWAKDMYDNYKLYRKKKEIEYEKRQRSKTGRGSKGKAA